MHAYYFISQCSPHAVRSLGGTAQGFLVRGVNVPKRLLDGAFAAIRQTEFNIS